MKVTIELNDVNHKQAAGLIAVEMLLTKDEGNPRAKKNYEYDRLKETEDYEFILESFGDLLTSLVKHLGRLDIYRDHDAAPLLPVMKETLSEALGHVEYAITVVDEERRDNPAFAGTWKD